MAINFLQSLFDPQRSPSMPFNPAVAPPAMPQISGNLQRMTQGAPDSSRIANLMQAIGGTSDTSPVQMPAAQQQSPARPRRSLLDTIGQISDVFARVGGAEALYQPTLDAREDRARQIDLEEMRKQQMQQQIEQGGQTLEAGEMELADSGRARLATALGAIASDPEAISMWPQIAAEAGIDDQQAQAIGQIIQNNPNAAGIFARSLGWSPETSKQGSQAKELQVYGLLQKTDPELAQEYLRSIARPDTMTPYETAQLEIRLAEFGLKREEAEFDRGIKREEIDMKRDEAEGGGVDLTPTQRGQIKQKLELLPAAKAQFRRVQQIFDEMKRDGTLARGAVGGLVPGAIAGGKAEQFDKAVGALRKSILSMTRVPGIGSMSNYETMLDEAALPARWGSDEGREEAINNIGVLLENYEQGYRGMLGSQPARSSSPAPRRGSGNRIMPRTPRGQRPTANTQGNSAVEAELRRRGLID